jgi:hypothetical protein
VLAPTVDHDVVVLLAGGTYRLAATFTLGADDSGVNGHAIIYRAAAGAPPILRGVVAITGFSPTDATQRVWVAPVPPGARSRQLYVGGRRATRARTALVPAGFTRTATGFALGNPAMAVWPDRGRLEVVGTREWKMFRCPVSAVAPTGITVAEPCWSASQAHFDAVAWLENARELVDEGGEFFLDEAAALLYYAPRAGEAMASLPVELPVLEELVHAEGTPARPLHDVAFEGLTFAYATWLAPSSADGYVSLQASITLRGTPVAAVKPLANVTFRATRAVRVTGCRFMHLGGAALAFDVGARANVVAASHFEDISASAVLIGDVNHLDHHPVDPAQVVADNTVETSYVTRAGAEYLDAPGVMVGYTTRTTIAHNELFDLPSTGISLRQKGASQT